MVLEKRIKADNAVQDQIRAKNRTLESTVRVRPRIELGVCIWAEEREFLTVSRIRGPPASVMLYMLKS